MLKFKMSIYPVLFSLTAALTAGWAQAATTLDLITENQVKIGEVQVSNDDAQLLVKFVLTNDPSQPANAWCLRGTRLKIAESPSDLSTQQSLNAIQNCVSEYTYTLPNLWDPGTRLFFSADAQVDRAGGTDALNVVLPNSATLTVTAPVSGGPAYFLSTITNGGILDGVYEGYCVDTHHTIAANSPVTVDVYSTFNPIPAGVIDHPERLNWVNWILGQAFVGKTSPGGFGTYTFGDVQRAIWTVISDTPSVSGLLSWSQDRVDEILADALIYGPTYVPGCNQPFAILLVPRDENGVVTDQITVAASTLVSLGIPCASESANAQIDGILLKGKDGRIIVFGGYVVE